MDSHKVGDLPERLTVVELGRRRRWPEEEKLRIVLEAGRQLGIDCLDLMVPLSAASLSLPQMWEAASARASPQVSAVPHRRLVGGGQGGRVMDREARDHAPPPTIAYLQGRGVINARLSCRNPDCGRTVTVPSDRTGLPDDTPFPQIARLRKWICTKCGSRKVVVIPDWCNPWAI